MPFDPELHPRGPDGRFITKGAAVKELTRRLDKLTGADLAEAQRLIAKLSGKPAPKATGTKKTGTKKSTVSKTPTEPTKEAIAAELAKRAKDKANENAAEHSRLAKKLSTKSAIPYTPDSAVVKKGLEYRREDLDKSLGKEVTDEQFTKWQSKVEKQAQKLVDNAQQFVAITPNALSGVLDEGRFKTQFETKGSRGFYSPELRANAESQYAGVPHDIDPTLRPVYGYMTDDPNGMNLSTNGYGRLKVELSEGVRDRSTVTFGDTLGLFDEAYTASPLNKVSGNSVTDWKGLGAMKRLQDLDGYVETQVHGGLSTRDIAKIHIPKSFAENDPEEYNNLVGKLKAKGIPHVVTDRI